MAALLAGGAIGVLAVAVIIHWLHIEILSALFAYAVVSLIMAVAMLIALGLIARQ
jgi:hypothetical protein